MKRLQNRPLCQFGFLNVAFTIILLAAGGGRATPHPITIDGRFPDWDVVEIIYEDAAGDGAGIDFGKLLLADDSRFLYLKIDLGAVLNLQQNNNLILYLDTDADDQTGLNINGIGAELEWKFGELTGNFYTGGSPWNIDYSDIRFRCGPSVTSSVFEMAIGRGIRPDGSHYLFNGNDIRIFFRDASTGGDELPEAGETITYKLDNGTPPPDEIITMGRSDPNDMRISTYNVERDGPWSGGQASRFGRQLAAVAPDILSFQEIYEHTTAEVVDFVSDWISLEPGESWYAAGNNDCHTISRYPVLESWAIDGNLAVLLDATALRGTQILVINAHLPCCEEEANRQMEVDHILSFIREAKRVGGILTLQSDTPILIMGDMNFVGLNQQVQSLVTGDIINEGPFGEDFHPDWDWTPMTPVYWRQTERRMGYTWRNDGGLFWPGHLDYVIFTDSVLEMGNHFVIYTPAMAPGNLAAYGLQSGDSEAADHLLCCVDFHHPDSGSVVVPDPFLTGLDFQIRPNPSAGEAGLALHLPHAGSFVIDIFDITGRRVSRPFGPEWTIAPEGTSAFSWKPMSLDGDLLRPGTYFVRLRSRYAWGGGTTTFKWTHLRSSAPKQ
ncbi:MAG: endonuclease/exonuclease/phosphatase family protein [Candidatus Eisenbacteria bacterium]|uniref:Endonuclease/exonuclease/phosphatase family protein n=1 Tax=Eiseniibacteriota bacterium TaxID=2212470 RepID=A0A948RYQ6_UNCEI|nr:endonuclease/exonuclease/phosphatase family protein [Candidatus Eisenbacteria bacterium]MBU2692053.1 endonuclease/exonuclease/phosphatase family protein [Candidatus Eisenbacteria bacterium]